MKIKSFIAASAMVVTSLTSQALASQAVTFADGSAGFSGTVKGDANSVFSQSISFSGLSAGVYDIVGDISSSFINFSSVTLDGHNWDLIQNKVGEFKYGEITYTGDSPMTLVLQGTKTSALSQNANFSGSVNVTLVPEPQSYAMLLAGLGLMGGIARRRANKTRA